MKYKLSCVDYFYVIIVIQYMRPSLNAFSLLIYGSPVKLDQAECGSFAAESVFKPRPTSAPDVVKRN